ncbi:argininosuccinate lyase [Virgibacillus byunsanensis]|uniref:Argininosuccinate lyase n=1 Tax=Virgibacillus byunsanensis TaxID=570945 RepID=A0ABW3LKQ3_9BACI
MRERLKKAPTGELIKYIIEPAIKKDLKQSYYNLLEVNKSHLVMLVEQELISREDSRIILTVIRNMELKGSGVIEIDPELEDLYFNIESHINQQTGIEIGGQLHTGRSRNDIYATITRLNSRDCLVKLCTLVNHLRSVILQIAKDNLYVIMPGYTHSQPAEPITFAHYLSGILHAIERDYERLENVFYRLNQSPLGSGAMASTTFNINRQQTAYWLGFDSVMNNSLDGIASRDYILEILSSLNIFMVNLSRFCHDLYTWSTDEFSYIEVDDSVAVCSSIMPQKKNPITLEHVKAKAAHLQGAFVSAISSLKNISYTHSRESSMESLRFYWDALNEIEIAVEVLVPTLKTLKVNHNLMLSRTKANFSTVTELANMLVREERVSFRTAHQIVANVVMEVHEKSLNAEYIDYGMVAKAFLEKTGKSISITEELISKALDPITNVNSRDTIGGPAPEEVVLQLEKIEKHLLMDSNKLAIYEEKIGNSKFDLNEKINQILSTH